MIEDDFDDYGPSKTSLKKEAAEAQQIGEKLLAFNDDFLIALKLDDNLLEAIQLAKKIKHHSGKRRQIQLVGKLMRRVDLAPIKAAIEQAYQAKRDERNTHHQAERLRDTLINEGESAIERLLADQSSDKKSDLKTTLKQIQHYTQGTPAYKKAYRGLFRQLIDLN